MRFALVLIAGALLAGCSVFGVRSGNEQSAYTISDELDDRVEIRTYPARLAVETPLPAGDEDGRDEAFRVLFAYITGANQRQADVAMTAPVETATSKDGEVMRFLLPGSYTLATAPKPTDTRVEIVELQPATVAALRFSGLWDEKAFETREVELLGLLEGSAWRSAGDPATLFYDPPWTLPFLRRNEMIVPVVRVAPA